MTDRSDDRPGETDGGPPVNELPLPDGIDASRAPLTRLAIVEESDDTPDQCTIYSVRDRETIRTTWISAAEGSYVALSETR